MSLKINDVTESFGNIVKHIKNQVRNNIVAAHRRSLVSDLNDRQVAQLCNIIDSTVDQAYTSAIRSEADALIKKAAK